jgi:hypothetical protein
LKEPILAGQAFLTIPLVGRNLAFIDNSYLLFLIRDTEENNQLVVTLEVENLSQVGIT